MRRSVRARARGDLQPGRRQIPKERRQAGDGLARAEKERARETRETRRATRIADK